MMRRNTTVRCIAPQLHTVISGLRPVILACLILAGSSACQEGYRIGDLVLVKWCEGEYPAYILARKGSTRYRVHFDKYEARWDTDVTHDKILRKLDVLPNTSAPLCADVARALGIQQEESGAPALYNSGAHVKVTWRGSVYRATVLSVEGNSRFKVHYEGYDEAWDEVVGSDRIVGAAP
jgi:hypothetical protein